MKKILMLLSNPFRPDVRVYKEAISLIKGGYDVTVVAWDRKMKYLTEERSDGINILRIPLFSKKHIFYLVKLWLFWRKAYRVAKTLDFDFIHCHDLDTLRVGIKLKEKFKKPLIYDIHDIYSYMIKVDTPIFISKIVQKIENRWMRKVDRIITVSNGLKNFYINKGLNPESIIVVMNCNPVFHVPEEKIKSIRRALSLGNKFVAVYIGTLEEGRFIKEMVEATKYFGNDIILLIGGYGKYEDFVKNKAEKSKTIKYIGVVSPKDVSKYIKCSDVVLSIYHPSMENQNISIVTKLFDAINAGKPIIVNKELRETAKIVKENRCGVLIDYSVSTFIDAINKLKDDKEKYKTMAENISLLRKKYNWENESEKLIVLYKKLLE